MPHRQPQDDSALYEQAPDDGQASLDLSPEVAPKADADEGMRSLTARYGKTFSAPSAAPPASGAPNAEAGREALRKRYSAPSPTPPLPSPAAPAAPEEAEHDWGTVAANTAAAIPKSVANLASGAVHAVAHPIETAGALQNLAGGLWSKAQGAVGVEQDPNEKRKSEAVVDALVDKYKTDYGTVAGFKHKLETDPASVLMDASTLAGGAGAGLKVAGLTDAAETAAKVGSLVDPISGSVKMVAKPLAFAGRSLGRTADLDPWVQKIATAVGATNNPEFKATYARFAKGAGSAGPSNAVEFQQRVDKATDAARQAASDNFFAKRGKLSGTVDVSDAHQAVADADAAIAQGARGGWSDATYEAQRRVKAIMDDFRQDPTLSDLPRVDAVKRQLSAMADEYPKDVNAQRYINSVHSKIRDALSDPLKGGDPEYAALMDQYQTSVKNINDIKKTLGAKSKSGATQVLNRAQRAAKNGNGATMLDELAQYDPHLPYALAGMASNPLASSWGAAIGDAAGGVATAAMFGASPLHAGPIALASMLASSPRVVMAANKAGGAASRLASKVPSRTLQQVGQMPSPAGAPGQPQSSDRPQSTAGAPKPGSWLQSVAREAAARDSGAGAGGNDVDALVRNAIAEGDQSDAGRAAVTHVALNRARLTGASPYDVVHEPHQFSSVSNGSHASVDPSSPAYQYVRDHIVVPAMSGKLPDPTNGATHFINKHLMKPEDIPSWAQGDGQRIGPQEFYSRPQDFHAREQHASGGRVERASGGRVDKDRMETLVRRLMNLAARAKRAEDGKTETLLAAPDEHIVKALGVAQRAI